MTKKEENTSPSRRDFLKKSVTGAVGAVVLSGFPTIVPASVLGKNAPSNRINIGMIGVGRIGTISELWGLQKFDHANIMAVCDLDKNRVTGAQKAVNDHYSKKTG